jgi:hypothetical protein
MVRIHVIFEFSFNPGVPENSVVPHTLHIRLGNCQ